MRGWFKAMILAVLLILFALCLGPALSQTCPDGCQCITETKAKEMFGAGNYQACIKPPCGEERVNGAIVPKYCLKPKCPQGCTCMSAEKAKEMGLSLCSDQRIPCGSDPNGNPLYCFSAPSPCPQGCRCLTEAQAKELGYNSLCHGPRIECGKDDKGYPMFCFQEPAPACPIGCICMTRDEATAKGLKENCLDATGKPIVCGVVDQQKGIFKYCFKQPVQQQCVYDYNLGKCVGGCPDSTICQLNTVYRDPQTGKVTYAECHCK